MTSKLNRRDFLRIMGMGGAVLGAGGGGLILNSCDSSGGGGVEAAPQILTLVPRKDSFIL